MPPIESTIRAPVQRMLARNFLPDSFVNLMLHWTNLVENEIYIL